MLIKSKFGILILGIILTSCQSQERYVYEDIKSDIELYLQQQIFNDFEQSDTLIIYDTSYFNNMVSALDGYRDKLVVEDSAYNQLILERLELIEVEKVQTHQPDIYLPFQILIDNFNKEKENTDKIMVWLANVPKQLEAAKVQLKTPNVLHTKLAIEELKMAFDFVSNDLKTHLEATNKSDKYAKVINNTQFAIKDYLAFLNSKLINQETN